MNRCIWAVKAPCSRHSLMSPRTTCCRCGHACSTSLLCCTRFRCLCTRTLSRLVLSSSLAAPRFGCIRQSFGVSAFRLNLPRWLLSGSTMVLYNFAHEPENACLSKPSKWRPFGWLTRPLNADELHLAPHLHARNTSLQLNINKWLADMINKTAKREESVPYIFD